MITDDPVMDEAIRLVRLFLFHREGVNSYEHQSLGERLALLHAREFIDKHDSAEQGQKTLQARRS